MERKRYDSFEKYYEEVAERFVEECTCCGECVRACPILSATSIAGKGPEEIITAVLDFLKEGRFSGEAYTKAFACASCATCSSSCPQGLDVMEVFGSVRMELVNKGMMPEAVGSVEAIPTLWRTVSFLLVKPSERRWLIDPGVGPKEVENVVFLGCTTPALPQIVNALIDVFQHMGLNFVALAGGRLCCGFPFFSAGKMEALTEKARELISALHSFHPLRVILPCAGCYRQFTKLYPLVEDLHFEVKYYADFLMENLDRLEFAQPLEKTVYYHASCMSRSTTCSDSVRRLLGGIPGLKVAEAEHICCGGTPKLAFFEIPMRLAPLFRERLAKAAVAHKADYLVNVCQLCELTFSAYAHLYPFELRDVAGVVNEAIGGKQYESGWAEFWSCSAEEEIIEKAKDTFEANGLTEDDVRQALPLLLSWRM